MKKCVFRKVIGKLVLCILASARSEWRRGGWERRSGAANSRSTRNCWI